MEKTKINKINLKKAVDSTSGLFQYLCIGNLNNHILNVLKAENRTLDFHIHEKSDELFYVIEGSFEIELENDIINMEKEDIVIIPKGVKHRPICKTLVKCLLIELDGTLNNENTGGMFQE